MWRDGSTGWRDGVNRVNHFWLPLKKVWKIYLTKIWNTRIYYYIACNWTWFFFISHLIILFSFILQYVFVYLINYIVFIGNKIFMLNWYWNLGNVTVLVLKDKVWRLQRVIRSRISKDRQYNRQKGKRSTKHYTEN